MQILLLACPLVGKRIWYVDPWAAPVDLAAPGSSGVEPAVPEVDPSPGGATALFQFQRSTNPSRRLLFVLLGGWHPVCSVPCGSASRGGKLSNMCTIHSVNDGEKADKHGLLLSELSFSLL